MSPKPSSRIFFGNTPLGRGRTGVGVNLNKRATVLLADDDANSRAYLRAALERLGYHVVEASNGTEAWKRLREGHIALAVLDMKMPGMHGLEILSRMKAERLRVPVLVCSAFDMFKDDFTVVTHKPLRYLVKPVPMKALEEKLLELLDAPRAN